MGSVRRLLRGRALRLKSRVHGAVVAKTAMRPVSLVVASLQLRRALRGRASPDDAARRLSRGWGNPSYAASEELVASVIHEVRQTTGPIVECGSGVTSLVLAAAHKCLGLPVVTLEHDAVWAATVRRRMRALGLGHDSLLYRPLMRGDRADWYSVGPADLPSEIGLLVCDGPPGSTRGGRAGVLDLVADSPPGVIIVDDVNRPAEAALCRVLEGLGYRVEGRIAGASTSHAVLTRSPGRSPRTPAP